MKRKKFIIGAAVAVAAGVPAIFYYKKSRKVYNTPEMPGMLALFCDEKILKEIGTVYREKTPAENDRQKLTDMLLAKAGGQQLKTGDKSAISELLDSKTKEDFSNFNIFTLKGWVISQTEARQCALFSLI